MLSKRPIASMVTGAIFSGMVVLLLTGCGQASITTSVPRTSADLQYGEVVVDFYQNDDQVGQLYVRLWGDWQIRCAV